MGVPPGGIVRPNATYLLRYLLTSCLEVMINIVLSSSQHCTGRLLGSSAFKASWLSNLPIIWWWQIVCNGIYKSNLLSYGKIKLIPCHQVVSSHVFMVCHDSSETRPYRQFKVSRTQSGTLMLCTKALQAFCEKNFFCAAFFTPFCSNRVRRVTKRLSRRHIHGCNVFSIYVSKNHLKLELIRFKYLVIDV